jgi:Domain of unknown function (DUF4157)
MPIFTPLQRRYADSSPPTFFPDRRGGIPAPTRQLSRSGGIDKKCDESSPAERTKSISIDSMEESSFRWDFRGISLRPLGRPALQKKLTINEPGDAYEQEADRVADQVMRTHQNSCSLGFTPDSTRTVRRACACGGTCAKCKEDEGHGHVQRKATAMAGEQPASAPPIVSEVLSTSGHGLDSATRAYMEPRFGYDFSNVRVHSDECASESARALQARANTVGRNIVFSNSEPSPRTPAAWPLMAHELAHVIQQQSTSGRLPSVMRAPDKDTKPVPPPPAPCTINCTDPKFLALSPLDRETQFTTQCPSGFPLDTTFFSQPIPGATSAKLKGKLLAAAARAKRLMCINGEDPNAYQLDRVVKTYSTHSPSESRAVDIDYWGQTYILHEAYAYKEEVESQLNPVYKRIAYWSSGSASIIPGAIKTVQSVPKAAADARTWTNPASGKSETTTTGELYDKLKAESDAMTGYFALLNLSDADFEARVKAFVDAHKGDPEPAKKLGLPSGSSADDIKKFRQHVVNDYRLLGGSKAQLKDFAGQADADLSQAPPKVKDHDPEKTDLVDLARPFRGGGLSSATSGGQPDPSRFRRPELGYIALPKEVVVALTQEGLVWGAIDFGGESGDVMHFDCRRDISGC